MKRQQKQEKENLQETQDRKHKKKPQMAKMLAKFKSSPRQEEVKKADRTRKKSRARTLNFDANNEVPRFCVVCNSCQYKKSVGLFNRNKFCAISDNIFRLVSSFDGNFYLCKTCGKKLNKNSIPCQAVCNMLEVCELPKEFTDIRRLERVLVARRLLFKKINIMPKVQSPKLKGGLCNTPIYVVDVCNTLPRLADSNGIIIVKL